MRRTHTFPIFEKGTFLCSTWCVQKLHALILNVPVNDAAFLVFQKEKGVE